MAVEVVLPRVDMDMTTGKFTQWFVAEGARVEKGQPLFEIETDKAAMEIEATASGVLRGVAAKPGDQLPVGTVVGVIVAPDEDCSAAGSQRARSRRRARADRRGAGRKPVAGRARPAASGRALARDPRGAPRRARKRG